MKKLLAIAVAAGLAAPAAVMADTTLYGKLHTATATVKSTTGGTSTTNTDMLDKGSRIGVKGSTPLDNGLSATYMLEYNLDVADDAGLGSSSARQTYVGLKGKFGEVRQGTQYGPTKLSSGFAEQFVDQLADYNNILQGGGTVEGSIENATAYINKFGNVGFAVAHTNSAVGASGGPSATDAMVNYSSNGLYLALGHQDVNDVQTVTRATAGYKFPAGHKIAIAHEVVDPDATGVSDTDATLISGSYKMGKTTLKAQLGQADNGSSEKVKLAAIGVDYSLGKKTKVYGEYATLKGDTAFNGGNTHVNGDKASGAAIGIMHSF